MVFEVYRGWAAAIQDALPAIIPLGIVGVWRWSFFLFRVVGYLLYKPMPPTYDNKYKTTDVTLIIPTIDTDEEAMHEAMRSWFLNEPYEIIIVTAGEDTQKELQRIASTSVAASITRVLRIDRPHKRYQLVHDDDAIWNANFLKWLLVPFDDPKMGGTGSSQIMRPNDLTKPPTVFERIADMRLSGRMLEACASTFYDGSVSCLSGRTALYHKRILTDNFPSAFCNEKWRNKYPLISGDDKYMTRWLVSHGWKMHMQVSPECTLATTFKADDKFFMQILRWTRNTWRSDFKSLVLERDIWYRYPVQAVLMVDRMVSPFTLMSGPVLFIVSMALIRKFDRWTDIPTAVCIWFLWLIVSRTCRMSTHFYRCPEDITYLPYFIAYQYYFAYLKLYALFTLHVTSWGTRAGVGGPQSKKTQEQIDEEAKQKARDLEEGFINQKARMERKRKMAEKSYWAGDISVMRRMHKNVSDTASKDDIEWATPLVLPGQSTLAFPVFNDPAYAPYMASQQSYMQQFPSYMMPMPSQMGFVPSHAMGPEYVHGSPGSSSTAIGAKAPATEESTGSDILAEKQDTAEIKKATKKAESNNGSSSHSGSADSLTFQPPFSSIGDGLSEAGQLPDADALYCLSRQASERSKSGGVTSNNSSPRDRRGVTSNNSSPRDRKDFRSQSSLARSSASPVKSPMRNIHANKARSHLPKIPSPLKSRVPKTDDFWDAIDNLHDARQDSPPSEARKQAEKDVKRQAASRDAPGNSDQGADSQAFSSAGSNIMNPADAANPSEPETQCAGLSFE